MIWVERKEVALSKMWKEAQGAQDAYREELLNIFWTEYRLLRKTKEFQKELKKPHSKIHNSKKERQDMTISALFVKIRI